MSLTGYTVKAREVIMAIDCATFPGLASNGTPSKSRLVSVVLHAHRRSRMETGAPTLCDRIRGQLDTTLDSCKSKEREHRHSGGILRPTQAPVPCTKRRIRQRPARLQAEG